ncbi:hypothetical protein RFI_17099, partial [Reticulomyxa filosa]
YRNEVRYVSVFQQMHEKFESLVSSNALSVSAMTTPAPSHDTSSPMLAGAWRGEDDEDRYFDIDEDDERNEVGVGVGVGVEEMEVDDEDEEEEGEDVVEDLEEHNVRLPNDHDHDHDHDNDNDNDNDETAKTSSDHPIIGPTLPEGHPLLIREREKHKMYENTEASQHASQSQPNEHKGDEDGNDDNGDNLPVSQHEMGHYSYWTPNATKDPSPIDDMYDRESSSSSSSFFSSRALDKRCVVPIKAGRDTPICRQRSNVDAAHKRSSVDICVGSNTFTTANSTTIATEAAEDSSSHNDTDTDSHRFHKALLLPKRNKEKELDLLSAANGKLNLRKNTKAKTSIHINGWSSLKSTPEQTDVPSPLSNEDTKQPEKSKAVFTFGFSKAANHGEDGNKDAIAANENENNNTSPSMSKCLKRHYSEIGDNVDSALASSIHQEKEINNIEKKNKLGSHIPSALENENELQNELSQNVEPPTKRRRTFSFGSVSESPSLSPTLQAVQPDGRYDDKDKTESSHQ